MEARYDIRLDKDYINANNDAEWYASNEKNNKDTIEASPGTYKENPSDGVAIQNFLLSSGAEDDVSQKIIFELQKDGYNCNNPIVGYDVNGQLKIDPNII